MLPSDPDACDVVVSRDVLEPVLLLRFCVLADLAAADTGLTARQIAQGLNGRPLPGTDHSLEVLLGGDGYERTLFLGVLHALLLAMSARRAGRIGTIAPAVFLSKRRLQLLQLRWESVRQVTDLPLR